MNHLSREMHYTNRNGDFNSECDFATPMQHCFSSWLLFFQKLHLF